LAPELTTADLLMPSYSEAEAIILRLLRAARVPFWRQLQAQRLLPLLRQFRPDIVWNHSLWIDTDVMIWTGYHPQVTVPYGYNEVERQPGRARARRRIYRDSDAFIDALPDFRRYFIDKERIPVDKFPPDTIYLGLPELRKLLDEDRSGGATLRSTLGIPSDETVLLESRGLRQPDGGAMAALHATQRLISKGHRLHLVLLAGLLGDAQVCDAVERSARELGIRDRVTIVRNSVSFDELVRYYAMADIFLSLLPSDALGKSIMEAAAVRCQLVLTDLPDYRTAFGPHAEYVRPADIDSVAAAIERVLSLTGSERRHRSDSIRAWLLSNQEFGTVCDRILAYFDAVVKSYRKEHPTT
jgi:glycosyltransferase involved in cell wall biosynthesis